MTKTSISRCCSYDMWCHIMTLVILTVQKESHGVHALQLIELFVSMLRYRNCGDYVIVTGGLRYRNLGITLS